MIADYATTGLTTGPHALGLLRDRLRAEGMVTSAGLGELPHRVRVTVAGIVVARQRPGTAKGVVFMLLEDEAGTINLVVPPAVYERDRAIVRSEPLVVAEGRLERHPMGGGQINVVVARLRALDGAERPAAQVKDFSLLDEAQLAAARGGRFPGRLAPGPELRFRPAAVSDASPGLAVGFAPDGRRSRISHCVHRHRPHRRVRSRSGAGRVARVSSCTRSRAPGTGRFRSSSGSSRC